MLVNLSYNELLQISSALATIENVYGNGTFYDLLVKVNDCMAFMDNAPITEVYPGVGTINT